MTHEEELEACVCGHSASAHTECQLEDCSECDCVQFKRQGDQEPADDADAWLGGFARNH